MQGISPFWDVGGTGGWTVQAGMFPFPGMSFGWSSAGGQPTRAGVQARPGMTQEEVQEQARVQQRNALVTFIVMIVLFALITTLSEMDVSYTASL